MRVYLCDIRWFSGTSFVVHFFKMFIHLSFVCLFILIRNLTNGAMNLCGSIWIMEHIFSLCQKMWHARKKHSEEFHQWAKLIWLCSCIVVHKFCSFYQIKVNCGDYISMVIFFSFSPFNWNSNSLWRTLIFFNAPIFFSNPNSDPYLCHFKSIRFGVHFDKYAHFTISLTFASNKLGKFPYNIRD